MQQKFSIYVIILELYHCYNISDLSLNDASDASDYNLLGPGDNITNLLIEEDINNDIDVEPLDAPIDTGRRKGIE